MASDSEYESSSGLDILKTVKCDSTENSYESVKKDENMNQVNVHNNGIFVESIKETCSILTSVEDITGANDTLNSDERKCIETETRSDNYPGFPIVDQNPFDDVIAEGIPKLCDEQQCFNEGSNDLKQLEDIVEKSCKLFPKTFDKITDNASDSQQDFSSDDASDSQQDFSSDDASNSQNFSYNDGIDSQQDFSSDDGSDSQQDFSSDDGSDSQQDFSSDGGSDSQQDFSSSEEGPQNLDFKVVLNKFLELCAKFNNAKQDENFHDQLPSDVADGIILIVKSIMQCWCHRKHGNKSRENTEENGWTNVIHDLVDFYFQINCYKDCGSNIKMNSEQSNIMGTDAAHDNTQYDKNTDNKDTSTHRVANWTEFFKELIIDAVKILLWIACGCKEVAAESYEANDVHLCSDGTSSINDLLSHFSGLQHKNFDDLLTWGLHASKIYQWLIINVFLKPIHLINIETCKREPAFLKRFLEPAFINRQMCKFVHWVNNNSCQFTNIEGADTSAEQPIIIKWINNWANSINYSTSDHIERRIDAIFFFPLLKTVLVLLFFHEHGDNLIITGLNTICKLLPHYGYFLRNVIHIILSWLVCVFSKTLLFAEKTGHFGKKLVKEVSILELIFLMNEDKLQKPSEFIELQEIVLKLSEDFQLGNISSRLKPEVFHGDQQDASVLTQTDTTLHAEDECKSVVDLLWIKFQDTLSQSNWCNAVADVTKITYKALDELRQFAFPESDEKSDTMQGIKGCIPVLSGSRLDGCVSLLSGPGKVCDFDVMAVMLRSDNYKMESVPDHPINVFFKTVNSDTGYFVGRDNIINHYLSPSKFKNDNSTIPFFVPFYPLLLFLPFHRRFNTAHAFQCGDVACTHLLFQGQKNVILSIDYVPSIFIELWPEQAQNWIHRNSAWPVYEIRESIAKSGCHSVPKTSKDGDPHREWRLSFSKAENTLCKLFIPCQKFHLSLLKAQFQSVKSKIGSFEDKIFKHYTITNGVFHTFHAKTAMFWFCENHPPTHKIWRKENVFRCQSELLESMEGMMREGCIPHYFIPDQNLLEGIAPELLQQAAGELNFLKKEARTEYGRVYQEIIKQPHEKDAFLQIMSEFRNILWRIMLVPFNIFDDKGVADD